MMTTESHRTSQTFLFADLAGFTALTEVHGDDRAADLVAQFCSEVRAILDRLGGDEVKAIGDALLLRADDPASAVRLGRAIVDEIGGRHGFPSVRVGAHTGPAVERDGDWFGATVNVASRVSDRARAGEVLVTRAVRDAAADSLIDLSFQPRGRERLKNVAEPVELFAVTPKGQALARRLVTDPVCQMLVDPAEAPVSATYKGGEIHFCSQACADTFRAAPAHFAGRRSRRGELRVSDDARDRAARFVRRAYERGEIGLEELEDRSAHAYAARTRHELTAVVRDLSGYRGWRLARRRRAIWFAAFPPLIWIRRLARRVRRWKRSPQ
jgi:adenylate cyclase